MYYGDIIFYLVLIVLLIVLFIRLKVVLIKELKKFKEEVLLENKNLLNELKEGRDEILRREVHELQIESMNHLKKYFDSMEKGAFIAHEKQVWDIRKDLEFPLLYLNRTTEVSSGGIHLGAECMFAISKGDNWKVENKMFNYDSKDMKEVLKFWRKFMQDMKNND